jgi:predicted  nucleic acid-binding Zn-ribbon protein
MLQNILAYQEIDKDLIKVENLFVSSEERKIASRAKSFLEESAKNVARMEKRAEELLSLYNDAKRSYDENAQLIHEYDALVPTLKSGDEATYLIKKVNQALDDIKALEKELASISKDMEDLAKSFNEFRAKYNAAGKEFLENREKYEKLKQEYAPVVKELKAKLEEQAKKIDPAILEKYKKRRADRIFPVLVEARGNKCGGCSMEISLKEMDKLRSKKIIECENCHRFIYYRE